MSAVDHRPTFTRHVLGRSTVTDRKLLGVDVLCSCGWAYKSNEPMVQAQRAFLRHRRQRVYAENIRPLVYEFLRPYKHGDRPWRELDVAEVVDFIAERLPR